MISSADITRLLSAWAKGDNSALERLIPQVYEELRRIADSHWKNQSPRHTLQPTALIHEAFLKLIDQRNKSFKNRSHFYAVASLAMRQVLVNHAEASHALKRGGGHLSRPLTEADSAIEKDARDVLALNEALDRLHKVDPRKSRVVELRYFGGLSTDEIAEALEVSPVTVRRDWSFARAWLAREIGPGRLVQL